MEKRTYKRLPVGIEADVVSGNRNYAAFIGNISIHGLHMITIHMEDEKDFPQTEMDLSIQTETGKKLNLHCKRKWSYAITPNSLINRIGMEIINPSNDYREFLSSL